jgi:CheY-like chemotaxis protein
LRLLGNQVETAYDGKGGIELARHFRPHMILLDLAMPVMDGYEARKRLMTEAGASAAFLVAMTGFGNEEDKRRTREAGFDAHLTKPVELDALVALLNEARTRFGRPQPSHT